MSDDDVEPLTTTRPSEEQTVQILVADDGNRNALQAMVANRYDVTTDRSLREADLYIVEDRVLAQYSADLRDIVEQQSPVFCPIVLIRRSQQYQLPETDDDTVLLIDDIIDAPVDQTQLLRRIDALLIRRAQSLTLRTKISTLEDRERELRQNQRELNLLQQILTRILRHNIRNDLTVILGQAERLQQRLPESPSELAKIIKKSEAIAATSETARDIAAIIERSEAPQPRDISPIVTRAIEDARATFPDATISADIPDRCIARASNEFQRAVSELIDNALTHNDAEDPRVHVLLEQSDPVRLVIVDNGPGIPETELEPLRNHEETSLEHGTSIGLWLIKWIVDQSGGTLTFDTGNDGTCVEIELPTEGLGQRVETVRPLV
jgi:signal transduction histidine kinase